MRTVLPLVLTALACRPETNIERLYPRASLAPDLLEFGEVAVPTSSTLVVYVENSGQADLVFEAWIEGDDVFTVAQDAGELEPRDSATLDVRFAPTSFLDYTADLVVVSNDEEAPELRVPLTGVGVDLPMPDIHVDPQTLEFTEVAPGSTSQLFLTVSNVGDAPLELGSIAQSGSGAFSLATDPSNNSIGPASEVPIIISYNPAGSDGDSGGLQIPSNDPDEPFVDVVLLGNGGGDFEYPDAEIACPGTSEPPIFVQLDGSGSSDPQGFTPLTYEWSIISQPQGSQAELTNLVTDSTELWTDLAGDYEVQLVVENSVGTRSAPERCAIQAIPADAIHVELTWDTSAADLDLHLARNNAAIFGGSDDCSYCQPSPNWGSPDASPRLDLDDQGGYGPENINIRQPDAGDYMVRVHYFEEHQDDAVTATVRVFLDGTLAWEGDRIMHENEVWDVGQVNWPDSTFGVTSSVNYPSPARSCF